MNMNNHPQHRLINIKERDEPSSPLPSQPSSLSRRKIYYKCILFSLALYLLFTISLMFHLDTHLVTSHARPYLEPPPSLQRVTVKNENHRQNEQNIDGGIQGRVNERNSENHSHSNFDEHSNLHNELNQQLQRNETDMHNEQNKQQEKNQQLPNRNRKSQPDITPERQQPLHAPPKPNQPHNSPKEENEKEPPPRLIHILETRFMQNQPNLIQLAKARLQLFKTICLPTVVRQSAWGNFLWIIRTDPSIDESIKSEMIRILQEAGAMTKLDHEVLDENGEPQERALTYLIGSNENYVMPAHNMEGERNDSFDTRHMLEAALERPDLIFAGDAESMKVLLDDISSQRVERDVIMWTRLDADDGLTERFMEYLQRQAIRYFLPQYYDLEMLPQPAQSEIEKQQRNDADERVLENEQERRQQDTFDLEDDREGSDASGDEGILEYVPPKWTYWCNGNNIDWFVTDLIRDPEHKNGTVYPASKNNFCITPGLTLVLQGSQDPSLVPRLDHHRLASFLKTQGGSICGRNGSLSILKEDNADSDIKAEEVDDGSCFHMVKFFLFPAVRSRTPTSAGMMGVTPSKHQLAVVKYKRNKGKLIPYMWELLKNQYGVKNVDLVDTNRYFGNHLFDIAEENARGQCTLGHSCKTSSKDHLQQFIDQKMELVGGFDVIDGKIFLDS
mmetsp:Transcript_429/g.872  ORF Transcript_429/g.872 Transcript_429/m.872 type:complete len:674 (-) Transcript_429:265-2286(-)